MRFYIADTNKVYTSTQFGVKVLDIKIPVLSDIEVIQDELPNEDKKFTYSYNHKNRVLELDLLFDFGSLSFESDLSDLIELLKSEVMFYTDSSFRYKCKLSKILSQKQYKTRFYRVVLELETTTPFKYKYAVPVKKHVTEPVVLDIINMGNLVSKPIIKVIGSFSNLSIGGLSLNKAIVSDTLIIDVEEGTAESTLTGNYLPHLSGEFLELPAGKSSVSISGQGLDLDIELTYLHTFR